MVDPLDEPALGESRESVEELAVEEVGYVSPLARGRDGEEDHVVKALAKRVKRVEASLRSLPSCPPRPGRRVQAPRDGVGPGYGPPEHSPPPVPS
jgi:hypothetical protein